MYPPLPPSTLHVSWCDLYCVRDPRSRKCACQSCFVGGRGRGSEGEGRGRGREEGGGGGGRGVGGVHFTLLPDNLNHKEWNFIFCDSL
jgi:hypothetical protein